jgi:Family of unknown function (DUF5715)
LILRKRAGTLYDGVALVSPQPPLMLRNVFIFLALAALVAASAFALPVVPAHPRKHAPAALAGHKTPQRAHAQPARPQSSRHGARRSAAYLAGYRAGHSSKSSRPQTRRSAVPSAAVPKPVHATAKLASLQHSRFVMPPPLKGSFESLARQNERAEADGLERILDEDDLASRIEQKLLVPIPASPSLTVSDNLHENHRYCRPWTSNFLTDLARAHVAQFHKPIEVSSAVRTVEYQQRLTLINGNAAAAEGDIVSPHLTGGTIDIVKQGMTRQELGWMRNWLLARQLAGTIDVEEEFRQPCFHITVYRSYTPPASAAPKPRRHHPAPAAQIASDTK